MQTFVALADPTRRQIVEMLAAGELTSGDIGQHFAISAPAISQHLKVLKEARLVTARVDGQRRIYALDAAGIGEIDLWLQQIRRFWRGRLDELERQLSTLPAVPVAPSDAATDDDMAGEKRRPRRHGKSRPGKSRPGNSKVSPRR
jgi:DNA-binding transcriptional ArsR family regulator